MIMREFCAIIVPILPFTIKLYSLQCCVVAYLFLLKYFSDLHIMYFILLCQYTLPLPCFRHNVNVKLVFVLHFIIINVHLVACITPGLI